MKRISIADVKNTEFYQMPKWVMELKDLSNDAKIAYMLLRDRHSLSIQNDWIDKSGNVFLFYTREKLSEILNCKNDKVIKVMKELKEHGLIEEKRQGQGKPNMIYLSTISVDDTMKSEKPKSGNRKNRLQEVEKTDTSNTDINNTDIYIKSVSLEPDQPSTPKEKKTDRQTQSKNEKEINQIFQNIEADLFQDEIRKVIKTAIISLYHKPETTVQGTTYTQSQIRAMLQELNIECIDTAIYKLRQQNEIKAIQNKAKYLQCCLLTASIETPADAITMERG